MKDEPKKVKPLKMVKQIKKEKPVTPEEKINHSYDEAVSIMGKIEITMEKNTREILKSLTKFESTVDKYEKTMEANTAVITMAEETLRNVLVAIRQNEYLQAWYPEQCGYPPMNVIGKHPCKLKKTPR